MLKGKRGSPNPWVAGIQAVLLKQRCWDGDGFYARSMQGSLGGQAGDREAREEAWAVLWQRDAEVGNHSFDRSPSLDPSYPANLS